MVFPFCMGGDIIIKMMCDWKIEQALAQGRAEGSPVSAAHDLLPAIEAEFDLQFERDGATAGVLAASR